MFKDTDRNTCRNALQELNSQLRQRSVQVPASLTNEQRQLLSGEKQFNLSADDLAEVESVNFTVLDAHHLDLCFLLRDAAQSLGLLRTGAGLGEDRQRRRAEVSFAWVNRQVRLRELEAEPLPPQFVLRRGWGSSLERSIIFLALLEQLGMEGCLVTREEAGYPSVRACGVLIGGDIYLFDPRMGMPLPGQNGQGIATLRELLAQPDLLKQLSVDSKFPYDVTPEQTSSLTLLVTCSLSSVAPRMQFLQERLQAAGIDVRLATEPSPVARTHAGSRGASRRRWQGNRGRLAYDDDPTAPLLATPGRRNRYHWPPFRL